MRMSAKVPECRTRPFDTHTEFPPYKNNGYSVFGARGRKVCLCVKVSEGGRAVRLLPIRMNAKVTDCKRAARPRHLVCGMWCVASGVRQECLPSRVW